MIHFSCDRCKRILEPEQDLRYVVKIEVQAALESADGVESEEDRDYLLEVHEILERLEDDEDYQLGEDVYCQRRFDLCPECYRKFMKNPIGREAAAQLGFSQN